MTKKENELKIQTEVDGFIDGVLDDSIPSCKWIKLAVKRQRDDLTHGAERDLVFNVEAGCKPVIFIEKFCKHYQGDKAGTLVVLEPWQKFLLFVLFGWLRISTGNRRFKQAYLEIARKNGKSLLAGAIGLFLMGFAGEQGAEVFSFATKREQARKCFDAAKQMVMQSPALLKYINVLNHSINMIGSASKFEPLSSDQKTTDGLNISCALIDELHEWTGLELYNKIKTSQGARKSPMTIAITTAGDAGKKHEICYQQHLQSKRILEGELNDAWFSMIFTIDDEDMDNWNDERVWRKANPNLGLGLEIDFYRTEALQAQQMDFYKNAFMRYYLNVWNESYSRWISTDVWNLCAASPSDIHKLKGRPCMVGLDLARTKDISCYVMVFPPYDNDDRYHILPRFFIPKDNILERVTKDKVPYDTWEKDNWLITTVGNITDNNFIVKKFLEDAKVYQIQNIYYDPYIASEIITTLTGHGFNCIEHTQHHNKMSPPSTMFERLMLSQKLAHYNHPIMNWNASNVVIHTDHDERIKPDKKKSIEKIDGIVAAIMSLSGFLEVDEVEEFVSGYSEAPQPMYL